ncbi:uncharacterized protein LOC142241316 isoform X2 [Haematobia irritans]|uniref:uncharacterized protein LOC142219955 isoform X2 n=1 Tax=Haematobia irritans TaxID=7368 RepID=UPI003F505E50
MAPSNIHQCLLCKRYHPLRFCRQFLNMDVGSRRREVRRLGYCVNCLARSHRTYECTSEIACRHCREEHHTLLHIAALPRVTLDEIERGRVHSDVRHLITSRRVQENILREAIDRQRIRDNVKVKQNRQMRLVDVKRKGTRVSRTSPRREILRTAMEALQRLKDALEQ